MQDLLLSLLILLYNKYVQRHVTQQSCDVAIPNLRDSLELSSEILRLFG